MRTVLARALPRLSGLPACGRSDIAVPPSPPKYRELLARDGEHRHIDVGCAEVSGHCHLVQILGQG